MTLKTEWTVHFQSEDVRNVLERLESRDPLPPLAPEGTWDTGLDDEIHQLETEQIAAGKQVNQPEMVEAIRSGLLLWNDSLKLSHAISQGLPNQTGSYWHGIMHRREPDFGNSKFWFTKTGDHPAFEELARKTTVHLETRDDEYARNWLSRIGKQGWDSFDMIDRCQRAVQGNEPEEVRRILEEVQLIEIRNLLVWCADQIE